MTHFPITVFDDLGAQIIENEDIFKALLNSYEYLSAAGGIVQNSRDEILMIFRRNKWDFPKGKIEDGESNAEAAIREVEEETGISAKIINNIPASSFHIYGYGDRKILKETFWFKMKVIDNQDTTPQLEEDITQVRWVPRDEVKHLLKQSYSSLRNLWDNF